MQLSLEIKGALPEEKQRGIEAAKAVFAAAGISPEQAADGMFALEGWDDASFSADEEPNDDDDNAASVWMDANKAAIAACCADWPVDAVPENHLFLQLVE
ncbi:hypothetical protein NKH34_13395 [Mesorhizobium sp. M1148]|uniref:hypothetical protein n=1 Tax=unclassified Mesorhizobium TaxID=325217 RepID=UPI0003CEB48D|nr:MULTISPECIES: hypothetical protein [unclassified Mesorhizobium]ESX10461.1 hypothetical protein X768_14300 [Mesorhizobium sp. LSJC265A00]ESX20957.1 hypothetical protein X766_04490 [Mesorhizobium sp. LSJC255A00]